jgi:hypothetical protein
VVLVIQCAKSAALYIVEFRNSVPEFLEVSKLHSLNSKPAYPAYNVLFHQTAVHVQI